MNAVRYPLMEIAQRQQRNMMCFNIEQMEEYKTQQESKQCQQISRNEKPEMMLYLLPLSCLSSYHNL